MFLNMMQPKVLQFQPSYNINCGLHENSYLRDNYSQSSSIEISLDSDVSASFPDVFTEFTSLQDDEFEDVCKWLNISDSEDSTISIVSNEASNPAVMEVGTESSLHHLLEAYAEAVEDGHEKLAEVIAKRVKGKVNPPVGETTTLERVAYNLFESPEEQGGYLRQESRKNFELGFEAFYQILPLGRFAHFAANSAILEAFPDDAEILHVVDFDLGEGIQWPPVIEAMARKRRGLRLTSINNQCRYEDTKRRLYDHADQFGLKLRIDEMSVDELVSQTETVKTKEWLAFNCMFRLPHMTPNRQQTIQATDFLRIAYSANQTGIIIFANGESDACAHSSQSYTSFFNTRIIHYKSLLESIQWHFPDNLSDARIALESIFIAPYINSESWSRDWLQNEIRGISDLQGRAISTENLVLAKELVNERESPYRVSIEEQKQNEMVLEWRGTPLVRVSTWM